MSIIYNTLERLEKLEKEGSPQTDRSLLGNTEFETHNATSATIPGLGIAFKIVVSIMLCVGATAIFLLRTNIPEQFSNSLVSQSQSIAIEPPIIAASKSILVETTRPDLPVVVSTEVTEPEWIPAVEAGESDSQPNDQINPLGVKMETGGEPASAEAVEIGSVAADLLQAPAAEPAVEVSEAVQSHTAHSNITVDLAEAESRASEEQPVDGQINTEVTPAFEATTIEIRPDLIGQALNQARLALSRGQYFQALATIESLSAVPDNRADYWLIKGSVHLGLGQLDLAEESFESAQALVPGHAPTLVQLAVLKQEKGDHAGAVALLEDAARRHREVPEIYLNLGYSQQALGEFNEAGRSFKKFLELTEGRSVYLEQRKMVSQWISRGPTEDRSIVDVR